MESTFYNTTKPEVCRYTGVNDTQLPEWIVDEYGAEALGELWNTALFRFHRKKKDRHTDYERFLKKFYAGRRLAVVADYAALCENSPSALVMLMHAAYTTDNNFSNREFKELWDHAKMFGEAYTNGFRRAVELFNTIDLFKSMRKEW